MAPEDKSGSGKADLLNKLMVARTNRGAMLLVALISGVISLGVSFVTLQGAERKLLVEDSLERAKIFQNLVETMRKSDDPTYALLALWKVFPEDDELIIMTAMMNPTPQTVSTLYAFGIADRLDIYNDTIKQMMINAPRQQRNDFSNTYRDISPQTVLEVLTESVIRTGGGEPELYDLQNLIGYRPEMLRPLLEMMGRDNRVLRDNSLQLRLARLVYDSDTAPLGDLIDQAAGDIGLFQLMSRELGNHLDLLSLPDLDRLMGLSLAALGNIARDPDLASKTGDIVQLFSDLTAMVEPSEAQRREFSDALVQIYLRKARQGKPDTSTLIAISRFSPPGQTAQGLFLRTLACVPHDRGIMFYFGFPAGDLAMENWDPDQEYKLAKVEATRRVSKTGEDCSTW